MHKQRGSGDGGIIMFGAFFIAVVFVIAVMVDSASCHSKWDRAGMSGVQYGPIQGCMVHMPDGRWLPEERIREVDIPKKQPTESGTDSR